MERTNKIVLQVGDIKQEFEISHAERILRMKDNGGWHVPENSIYQFDELNGLTVKRNKRPDKKSGEEPGN